MKKLFIFYVLSMLIIMGCAKSANAMSADSIRSYVYCVEGYKFLYVFISTQSKGGVEVNQIMKNSAGRAIPMECDGTEPKPIIRQPIKY